MPNKEPTQVPDALKDAVGKHDEHPVNNAGHDSDEKGESKKKDKD